MPWVYDLILDEAQVVTLTAMRDHHARAYMRERAGALLKVAGGQSIKAVAERGLLRPREWETVATWVKRYEQAGLAGLYLRRGRDASRRFPPQYEEVMREDVVWVLRQETPREHGLERTRWRLADFIGYLPGVGCRSAVWRVFQRLGLRYRRGWGHLVSPDPWAETKLAWIAAVQQRAEQHPDQVVVLWLDELTFYRLPSLAASWGDAQGRAMKARLSPGNNTRARVVGALNARTGQVEARLRSQIGAVQLQQFYQQVRDAYAEAEEVYIIQDCWPVHFLPEVVRTACALGLTLVALPTYSSWRNPIEKLWRWLKQAVLHLHRWTDDWPQVKQAAQAFLDQFPAPSPRLLRYVGLSD